MWRLKDEYLGKWAQHWKMTPHRSPLQQSLQIPAVTGLISSKSLVVTSTLTTSARTSTCLTWFGQIEDDRGIIHTPSRHTHDHNGARYSAPRGAARLCSELYEGRFGVSGKPKLFETRAWTADTTSRPDSLLPWVNPQPGQVSTRRCAVIISASFLASQMKRLCNGDRHRTSWRSCYSLVLQT